MGTKGKIAIVLPNHVGDVVMATPALRALRCGFPEAEISALVRAPLAGLLGGCPWIDRLIGHEIYEGAGRWRQFWRRLAVGRGLKGASTVILLPNSLSSAFLALASGAPRRLGYARRGRDLLLTEAVAAPRGPDGHFVPVAMERYYLDLVSRLGCADTGTELELFTEAEAERACDDLFAEHGIRSGVPLVCLAPGAGYGPSKLWPPEYMAQVASALRDDGAQLALVHGPGEEELAEKIIDQAAGGIASLGGAGMSLSLLKSVLARAQLVLCNDAGARHVSAAFGVPTIVLMGPTSVAYTNLNLKRTKLMREPVDCSPCQLKVCPIDHRCMTRLRPERVLEEARAALSRSDWQGSVELELGA